MSTKIIVLLSLILLIGCRSNKSQGEQQDHQIANIVSYIDSTAASKAIIYDDVDGFFDQISIIDMSIQMKQDISGKTRPEVLTAYKEYLQTEVIDWSDEEKIILNDIFDTIATRIHKINPNLMPDDIRLIKTKTNHYGEDVYYTRGHNIMIPENALSRQGARQMLEPVMFHEVFHLISRYDIALRERIYALIGFFPHERDLEIPITITDRWLTNPDGVSTDYYIRLTDGDRSAKAIPLILSNKSNYTPSSPTFFSYLQFDLFEMIEPDETTARVMHGDNLSTTLSDGMMPGFFEQIKDNTQYIIHPDEISADNFIYAINATEEEFDKKFSREGMKLVRDIRDILKSWGQ